MNKHLVIIFLVVLPMLFGCQPQVIEIEESLDTQLKNALNVVSKTGSYEYFIMPEDGDYASIPNQEASNPITRQKVELGRMLFFETGMANRPSQGIAIETYSCATCHIPTMGFTPGATQGIADGGFGFGINRMKWPGYADDEPDAQGARPLSVLNVAYVTNTFWNGQFGANAVNIGTDERWEEDEALEVNFTGMEGLECQNIEGLDVHRMEVTEEVLDSFGYREMFDEAFGVFPEELRYDHRTASFALSAYLRTLFTNEAPFQKWLRGDQLAMTEQQKRGALIFLDKARCTNCHKGPSFNSMEFHALGVKDLYETGAIRTSPEDKRNFGRGGFNGHEEDYYKFKVPQLYNLKDYRFFFHGSSKESIREVVEYKLRAESENPNVPNSRLSSSFNPVDLTQSEIDDLVEFLENGLYDANILRHVPNEILSGYCFPNNDPFSIEDQGCN